MAEPFSLSPWMEDDPVVAAQAAREAAARRIMGGVVPARVADAPMSMAPGQRQEGGATRFLDSLGESIYNTAARPSRIINETMSLAPGELPSDNPAIRNAVTQTGIDMIGLPGLASAVPRGALGSAAGEGIRAYHGSPHDFDRFDLSKIGTGEGAQAYGHGLYFAENPKVAQDYKNKLAPAATWAGQWLQDAGGDVAKAKQLYLKSTQGSPFPPNQETLAAIERAGAAPNGRMYEVNINAHPDQFLNWDAPLRKQSPTIQGAFNDWVKPFVSTRKVSPELTDVNIGKGAIGAFPPSRVDDVLSNVAQHVPTDGSDFYRMIGGDTYRHGDPTVSSSMLRDAGIPGIKYLDQGSRSAGSGTNNYVLFNDQLVKILRKYALPGMAGGGAAFGSMAPQDQQ